MAVDGHLNFDTSINSSGFNKGIAELQKSLDSLKGAIENLSTVISKVTNITFHADTSEVSNAASQVENEIENIPNASVQVETDTENAEQELENLNNIEINDTDIQVNADTESAESSIEEVETQVGSIGDSEINVDVEADTSDIDTAADDIDSLGDTSEETSEEISDDFDKASKKMQKSMNKGINGITNCLSGLKSSLLEIGSLIGVTFSVSALVNFSKSAKEAYNVQLEGETKLETVLGKHLGATKEQIKATKEYASALQEVGVIGDEVQLAGLQELSTYIENPESLKTMNGVLNDMLAQQYGLNASAESAVTISTMLGKVLAGQTSALSRYGYTFDEAQEKLLKYGTEEQRVATLADVVLDSVGGMNEALAQTPAGRMKQLENTMSDIKEQFGEAVTQVEVLLLPALKKVASTLQLIAEKAKAVTQALSEVFGVKNNKSVSTTGTGDVNADLSDSTETLADNADETADSYEDMAKAAEDANKANREDLAAFDELNVKAKDITETEDTTADLSVDTEQAEEDIAELDTGITIDVDADTEKADSKLVELIEKVKSSLENFFEPIKKAWDKHGKPVVDSLKDSFEKVKKLFLTVGESFSEVWNDGTGYRICSNILSAIENINKSIGILSDKLRRAWKKNDTGKKTWQNILGIVEDLSELFDDISEISLDWLKGLDLSPAAESISALTEALRKLLKALGDKLKTAYEKILLPLAKWAIEEIIPKTVNALAKALEAVSYIVDGISEETLMSIASGLSGIGTAIVVFKTGQTIAKGIGAIGDAIKNLGAIMSGNSVLAIAGIIVGITAAVIEYNKLKWSNSEAGKFAAEIDRIKDDLEGSTEAIRDTLSDTKKAIDDLYTDNTIIDNYQEKLNQLLEAGTLDEKEQAELNTIVSYFEENIDGFSDVWSKYITTSDEGKVELTGDLKTIQNEINKTIDEYQRMSTIEALQELYSSNTKEMITSQTELSASAEAVREKQEKVNQVYDEWQNALKNGSPELSNLHDLYAEENKELDELKNTYNENVAAANKLTMTNDDLMDVMGVLNGDYSDAAAVLMAYNSGMINLKNVTENGYKSLSDLEKQAKDSGKNLVLGVVEGTEDYKNALITNSRGLANKVLSEYDKEWDINSPSKEMAERGNYLIEGLINGVEEKENSVLSTFGKLNKGIKSIFESIPEWFTDVFSTAWDNVKSVFSEGGTVFTGIKDGILSELKGIVNILIDGINTIITVPFNGLNSALNNIRGFSFDGYSPFWNLPYINVPQIPHLATGTVVPANYGEFAAVLGDNKREPEVVSPLSTMKQAVIEAMAEVGFSGGDDRDIVINIDGREVFRVVRNQDNHYKRMHGKSAFA